MESGFLSDNVNDSFFGKTETGQSHGKDNSVKSETSELFALLKSVQNELSTLRADVNTLKENKVKSKIVSDSAQGNQGDSRKPRYICKNCNDQGFDTCNHCFKCCGEEHIAKWCPTNKRGWSNQGNEEPSHRV